MLPETTTQTKDFICEGVAILFESCFH